jgi:hypothetical protein
MPVTKQTEFISTNVHTLLNEACLETSEPEDHSALHNYLAPWYNGENPEVKHVTEEPEASI